LRRREDKVGPIQLLFPVTKPSEWLERGSRSKRKKEIEIILGQGILH
jgi:hypothetical protein